MPREQISIDIPDEWNENMKHGRCWCGKPKSEFDTNQKFYCSELHSKEYSKRIKYWSVFKEEVLEEQGRKCSECGHTKESFEKQQEILKEETYNFKAKEYPLAIKQARAVMVDELQRQFELIKNDGYVLQHMPYQIKNEYDISTNDIFDRTWFNLEVDHIKAVALGGEMWDKKNLRILCTECHKIKTKDDMKKLRIKRKQDVNHTLDSDNIDCN